MWGGSHASWLCWRKAKHGCYRGFSYPGHLVANGRKAKAGPSLRLKNGYGQDDGRCGVGHTHPGCAGERQNMAAIAGFGYPTHFGRELAKSESYSAPKIRRKKFHIREENPGFDFLAGFCCGAGACSAAATGVAAACACSTCVGCSGVTDAA